jgi:hypothetical protein
MSAAKESRDRKHVRAQIDAEAAPNNPDEALPATVRSLMAHIESLEASMAELQAQLRDVHYAWKLERTQHDQAMERAEEYARQASEARAELQKSYADVVDELCKKQPITKYDAMLLMHTDGYVLVHPRMGGLGSFKTLDEARAWATAHNGFIPHRPGYHNFHGMYYRVLFDIWPETK